MSLVFNETCFNERLLPNNTYFKIHDPAAHHNTDNQKYCCSLVKRQINFNREKIITLNTKAHNMASEGSKSARDNFGKFTHQFQPETKTLIRKLERILNKLYGQNLSLLFNEICLNEQLLPNYTHTHHTHSHIHTHTYIYIYIYFIKKKTQTSRIRIINLFPSCYVFLIKSKNPKKI